MPEPSRLDEAREALERIIDYFDQRADAEAVGDPARYQGNREMHLRRAAETVASALATARADGAREGMERAAKLCEVKVRREVGYGGRWEGYGEHMGDRTGPECAAAIRATAKEPRP